MEILTLTFLIFVAIIFAASYYHINHLYLYVKEYDKLLNHLMDNNTPITVSYLTAKFKDTDFNIWIGNYPYCYGNTYPNSTVFPSMKTRKRLANYIIQHQAIKP